MCFCYKCPSLILKINLVQHKSQFSKEFFLSQVKLLEFLKKGDRKKNIWHTFYFILLQTCHYNEALNE